MINPFSLEYFDLQSYQDYDEKILTEMRNNLEITRLNIPHTVKSYDYASCYTLKFTMQLMEYYPY